MNGLFHYTYYLITSEKINKQTRHKTKQDPTTWFWHLTRINFTKLAMTMNIHEILIDKGV